MPETVRVLRSDVRIGRMNERERPRLRFVDKAEVRRARRSGSTTNRSPERTGGPVSVGRRDKENTGSAARNHEPTGRIGYDDVALVRYRNAGDTVFRDIAYAVAVCVVEDDAVYNGDLAKNRGRNRKNRDGCLRLIQERPKRWLHWHRMNARSVVGQDIEQLPYEVRGLGMKKAALMRRLIPF